MMPSTLWSGAKVHCPVTVPVATTADPITGVTGVTASDVYYHTPPSGSHFGAPAAATNTQNSAATGSSTINTIIRRHVVFVHRGYKPQNTGEGGENFPHPLVTSTRRFLKMLLAIVNHDTICRLLTVLSSYYVWIGFFSFASRTGHMQISQQPVSR